MERKKEAEKAARKEARKQKKQYDHYMKFLIAAEGEIIKQHKRLSDFREDGQNLKPSASFVGAELDELKCVRKSAEIILSDECIDLPSKIEAMSALEISFNTQNKWIDQELRAMKAELEWEKKTREGGTRNTRRRVCAEVNPAV